jgi:hypothetical protein
VERLIGLVSEPKKTIDAIASHFSKEGGTVGEVMIELSRSDNDDRDARGLLSNTNTNIKDNLNPYI